MTTYGNEKHSKIQTLMFWGLIVPALILLFAVLTQPAWRGEQMLAEMRANCDKVGGVMLETKQPLVGGSTYECSPRYDKAGGSQ